MRVHQGDPSSPSVVGLFVSMCCKRAGQRWARPPGKVCAFPVEHLNLSVRSSCCRRSPGETLTRSHAERCDADTAAQRRKSLHPHCLFKTLKN